MFEKNLNELLANIVDMKQKHNGFLKLLAKKSGVNYPYLSLIVSGKQKMTTDKYSALLMPYMEIVSMYNSKEKELVEFKKRALALDPKLIQQHTGMQLYYIKEVLNGKRKLKEEFYEKVKDL